MPIVGSPLSTPSPPLTQTLLWQDEGATASFAVALAAKPSLANAFIELHGDLGAGKTSLARHLLRALGVQGRVKSPTYAVVEPYTVAARAEQAEIHIWHFDFYRFTDPREWEEAGFRELFAAPGLKLAEWADKVRAALPTADLKIALEVLGDDARRVTLTAQTPLGQELLA